MKNFPFKKNAPGDYSFWGVKLKNPENLDVVFLEFQQDKKKHLKYSVLYEDGNLYIQTFSGLKPIEEVQDRIESIFAKSGKTIF